MKTLKGFEGHLIGKDPQFVEVIWQDIWQVISSMRQKGYRYFGSFKQLTLRFGTLLAKQLTYLFTDFLVPAVQK